MCKKNDDKNCDEALGEHFKIWFGLIWTDDEFAQMSLNMSEDVDVSCDKSKVLIHTEIFLD